MFQKSQNIYSVFLNSIKVIDYNDASFTFWVMTRKSVYMGKSLWKKIQTTQFLEVKQKLFKLGKNSKDQIEPVGTPKWTDYFWNQVFICVKFFKMASW